MSKTNTIKREISASVSVMLHGKNRYYILSQNLSTAKEIWDIYQRRRHWSQYGRGIWSNYYSNAQLRNAWSQKFQFCYNINRNPRPVYFVHEMSNVLFLELNVFSSDAFPNQFCMWLERFILSVHGFVVRKWRAICVFRNFVETKSGFCGWKILSRKCADMTELKLTFC